MTLPASGSPISFSQIATEFGMFSTNNSNLGKFYLNGLYVKPPFTYQGGFTGVPSTLYGYPNGVKTAIPTSGQISASNFNLTQQPRTYWFTYSQTWVCPTGVTSVEVLLVGGGGGGGGIGGSSIEGGGGGGGGGVYYSSNYSVSPGTTYTITIGAGGSGGNHGSNGADTKFSQGSTDLIIALGGGGGGGYGSYSGYNGGSGGGGCAYYGAGAGGAGLQPTSTSGGYGGNGSNGAENAFSGGGGGAASDAGYTYNNATYVSANRGGSNRFFQLNQYAYQWNYPYFGGGGGGGNGGVGGGRLNDAGNGSNIWPGFGSSGTGDGGGGGGIIYGSTGAAGGGGGSGVAAIKWNGSI